MFLEYTASFPDDMLKSGIYLGVSLDIGLAITAKILMQKFWASAP